jgi:hypothetical protein
MRLRLLRLPLRSGGLRRGPSSSSNATRKTWAGRRCRLDHPQSRHLDGRRRTRRCARAPTIASTAAAAAAGGQAADLSTGRFEPPQLRFDPLLPIDPRRLVEINAGALGGSRETGDGGSPFSKEEGRAIPLRPVPATVEWGADRTDGAAAANRRAFTGTIVGDHKISGVGYSPSKAPAGPSSPPGKFSSPHGLNPRLTKVF